MGAPTGGGADYIWALQRYEYSPYIYLLSPDLDSVEATYQLSSTWQCSGFSGAASCCGDANGSVWFVVQNSSYERYPARMQLDGTFHVDTNTNLSAAAVCSNETTIFYHGNNKNYVRTYDYDTSTLQNQGTNTTFSGMAGGYRVMTYCADKDILIVGGNNTSSTDYLYSVDYSGSTPSLLGTRTISSGGAIMGDYYNAEAAGGAATSGRFCFNQQYNGDVDFQYTVPTTGAITYAGNLVTHNEYAYSGFQILTQAGYGVSGSFYADAGDNTVLYKFSNNGSIATVDNTYYNALTPSGITMNAGTDDCAANPVNNCFYFNGNLGSGSYNSSAADIFKLSVDTSNDLFVWDTSTTEELGNTWQSGSTPNNLMICHSSPDTVRQTGG